MKDVVQMLEKANHLISNVAKVIFDHPDFLEYKKGKANKQLQRDRQVFMSS